MRSAKFGLAIVAVQWILRFGLPAISPAMMIYGILAGVVGAVATLVWWLFHRGASPTERWGAIALLVAAIAAAPAILHPSIANGMMGMMFRIHSAPIFSLALAGWAALSGSWPKSARLASLAAAIFSVAASFAMVRTGGVDGEGRSALAWRWSKDAEQALLELPPPPPAPAAPAVEIPKAPAAPPEPPEWPGFRGPLRDGTVRGAAIGTDWKTSPPVEVWRRKVGPAWSSFAVGSGLLYTQEQRGEEELVTCYRADTGAPVWTHRDKARFWESNAGAGPRSTPTLHGGRVYTMGGTGIVNVLDAATGARIWTRNAAEDTGAKLPAWGFAASPLVTSDGKVIVAASGRAAAYDADGKRLWTVTTGGGSYSSPHLARLGGVEQVLLPNGAGIAAVAVDGGAELWKYAWEGTTTLQPALLSDGLLLAPADMSGGVGLRRLTVGRAANGWSTEERWTSRGLKPYFNDFVVHAGHAYGFDGSILACISLDDGARKWKGGRYGHGQLLLLAGQNLLLVLSEEGEVALAPAEPGEFRELARIPALEGKTWNHPVVASGLLFVRNAEEMAAFRLPPAAR